MVHQNKIVIDNAHSLAHAFTLISKSYGIGKTYEVGDEKEMAVSHDRKMKVNIIKVVGSDKQHTCTQDIIDKLFDFFATSEYRLTLCQITFFMNGQNHTNSPESTIEIIKNNYIKMSDAIYFYLSNILAIFEPYLRANKQSSLQNGLLPMIKYFDMEPLQINIPIHTYIRTKLENLNLEIKNWFQVQPAKLDNKIMALTYNNDSLELNKNINYMVFTSDDQTFFDMNRSSDGNYYKLKQLSFKYTDDYVSAVSITYDKLYDDNGTIIYTDKTKNMTFGKFDKDIKSTIEIFDFEPTEYIYNLSMNKDKRFALNDMSEGNDPIISEITKNNENIPIHSFNFLFHVLRQDQYKLIKIFPNYGKTNVEKPNPIEIPSDSENEVAEDPYDEDGFPYDADIYAKGNNFPTAREGGM